MWNREVAAIHVQPDEDHTNIYLTFILTKLGLIFGDNPGGRLRHIVSLIEEYKKSF